MLTENNTANFIPAFLSLLNEKARYKGIKGGRGSGKSEAVADILISYGEQEKDQNILCTRQTQTSIASSVYSLIERKIKSFQREYYYKFLNHGIFDQNGSQFIFKGLMNLSAQNAVKSIDEIKYAWVEEAHCITQEALDLLIPSVRGENSEIFFTWNPYSESDPVNKLFNSLITSSKRMKCYYGGKWYYWTEHRGENAILIEINYDGNPFFPEILEIDRRTCELSNPDDYEHTWEGKPMSREMNNIISGQKVKDAMSRKVEAIGQIEIGCDVARFGDDSTVITKRKGYKVFPQRVYKKIATTTTAGHCIEIADNDKSINIKVDDTGVGGGVTDNLTESKYNVVGVNNNQTPNKPDRYCTAIDEMWFELEAIMHLLELPHSEKLKDQLTQRRYGINKNGQRFVESKKEYKARCGESPDLADSLLLSFYHPKQYNYYNSSCD